MRLSSFPFALLLIATVHLAAASTSAVDVYLIAGQSNGWRISTLAAGNTKLAGKIHYFSMKCVSEPTQGTYRALAGLNPNTMGAAMASELSKMSDDDIVFIQYCRCGAGVWNKQKNGWYPGDDPKNGKVYNDGLYGCFLQYIAHARGIVEGKLKLKWQVKGLFWHQGESDARKEHVGQYQQRLTNLFYRFRKDLAADSGATLPIVMGHIRGLDEYRKAVNAIMTKVADADANTAVVRVDDLTFESPTNVHFNKVGCHNLSRRMVAAYKALIAK